MSAKRWLGLKPDGPLEDGVAPVDMVGPVTYRFRPVLPADDQAMAMLAMQLYNAPKPLISHVTALSNYLQLEDPEGEIDRIALDQAMEDPQLKMQWIAEALRKAGIVPPPPPPAPPGILGPNGQPLPPSGAPGGVPGQLQGGMPMLPTPNVPTMPTVPTPPHGAEMIHGGGHPGGGVYPGIPGGPHNA